MWSTIAPGLGNHLWQSTVFVGFAALLTLALRKNHARARYWLWLAASLKFLIPFSLLVSLGKSARMSGIAQRLGRCLFRNWGNCPAGKVFRSPVFLCRRRWRPRGCVELWRLFRCGASDGGGFLPRSAARGRYMTGARWNSYTGCNRAWTASWRCFRRHRVWNREFSNHPSGLVVAGRDGIGRLDDPHLQTILELKICYVRRRNQSCRHGAYWSRQFLVLPAGLGG